MVSSLFITTITPLKVRHGEAMGVSTDAEIVTVCDSKIGGTYCIPMSIVIRRLIHNRDV